MKRSIQNNRKMIEIEKAQVFPLLMAAASLTSTRLPCSTRLLSPSWATSHVRPTIFPVYASGGKGFGEILNQRKSKAKEKNSCFAVSASARDDASSSNGKQSSPLSGGRRRGQIPPEWEELSKPVPEPPNYLLLAAGFSLVYVTRQAIAEELVHWASLLAITVLATLRLTQRVVTLFLVKMLQLVKVPVAWVMILAGWSGIFLRDMYSIIVSTTSIWPTTRALLLVTLVLSIGEATNPRAISDQPWSFLLASAFGVGAVWQVIHHSVFVLFLLLLTGYSLLVQKKDAVLAALPATAVLVAIAERPLKAVALLFYLATAIYTHWRTPKEDRKSLASNTRTVQPLILVVAALFVGLAAGSRFLSAWQILWLAK